MRVADLVMKALRQQGVDTVFGYPGGTIMPIYDALYQAGLKHVLCRHEQGAAFAADGYARASGRPGVCFATSGPGATNLVTGLADAFLDSVPVVAITGQVATDLIGTDAFQEVDVLGLSLSVTKHSFLVHRAEEVYETLQEAFRIAAADRPGPVLVDIPRDVQLAETPLRPALKVAEDTPAVDPGLMEEARAMLRRARRPVLYVGGGVGKARAVGQLREFIDMGGGLPSVTTLKGIGTVPPLTPGFLGMIGMHGNAAANKAVQACDLLICAGARFDDRVTGRLPSFAPKARVLHLDVDAAEVGKRRPADVGILGDLRQILPALAQPLDIAPWRAACASLRDAHAWNYDHPGGNIYPPLFLRQLSDMLGGDAVVCCDVGQHQMWVAQHMHFSAPENHLSSGGLGAMGFGLPAAIGAQMSRPGACVVNVAGDGSIMMNIQELATVRRYGLPIKIVVLDNQRLGMVKQWQELFFEQRYSETELPDNPDFRRLAEVFHIPGRRISRREEVRPALEEMLGVEGAYLLHVEIDPKENVWPLVPPGAANDQLLEDRP